tara:strand:- start:2861 stop:4087 length:1227 start_codon:yes stop_codon:yes gene_type:complete
MKISKKSRVVIYGLGYIGLPSAVFMAENGYNVTGVDINSEVVNNFNNGKINFYEPLLDQMLLKNLEKKKLTAKTEVTPGDVYIIVVPTPFKENYQPDIKYIYQVIDSIVNLLKENDLIIIESTSPVGTSEKMYNHIIQKRKNLNGKIQLAYCPERVIPGNIIYELKNNDRVIGGIDEKSTLSAGQFYKSFVDGSIHLTDAKTAEMCKLVENASRDNQIAFANEISIISSKAGIDPWELISLANKHPRVNILNPSCGVGGHCIAVDPYFISSQFPGESNIISASRKTNNYKSFWCFEKISKSINKFINDNGKKPKVSLMGITYKPNVDDMRESPALYILDKLIENHSSIDFMVVEPNIKEHNNYNLVEYSHACENSDIICFLVNHREFSSFISNDLLIVHDFCGVLKNK